MAKEAAHPVVPAVESYYTADVEQAFRFLETLVPRVQDGAVKYLMSRLNSLENQMMRRCESPIEQLLWFVLDDMVEMEDSMMSFMGVPGFVLSRCQAEVETPRGLYRLDFLVTWAIEGNVYRVGIECDGHDFHEKTKEQAAHDKQRDRALAAAGYTVLRFTGSEIWNNPEACVEEVRRVFTQLFKRDGLGDQ